MRVDELNDETERAMDEQVDRIRALEKERDAATERADSVEAMGNRLSLRAAILETERDAALKRAEEAEGDRVRLESAATFYRDGQRQEEKSHLQAAAYAEEMKKQVASLRSRLSEHEASATLRHGADERAIARWQEATGRRHVLPDHADLCVWLLERLDEAQAREGRERGYKADIGNMLQEAIGTLRGIAQAKRFDREIFADDSAFVDWATSRARWAVTAHDSAAKALADRAALSPSPVSSRCPVCGLTDGAHKMDCRPEERAVKHCVESSPVSGETYRIGVDVGSPDGDRTVRVGWKQREDGMAEVVALRVEEPPVSGAAAKEPSDG